MPSLLTLSGSGNAIMLLGRPSAPYESPQIQRRSCFGWVGNAGLCYPRSAPPAGGDGPELLELAEAAFYGVALPVVPRVEGGWPAAGAAPGRRWFFWSSLTGMTALMPRWSR